MESCEEGDKHHHKMAAIRSSAKHSSSLYKRITERGIKEREEGEEGEYKEWKPEWKWIQTLTEESPGASLDRLIFYILSVFTAVIGTW